MNAVTGVSTLTNFGYCRRRRRNVFAANNYVFRLNKSLLLITFLFFTGGTECFTCHKQQLNRQQLQPAVYNSGQQLTHLQAKLTRSTTETDSVPSDGLAAEKDYYRTSSPSPLLKPVQEDDVAITQQVTGLLSEAEMQDVAGIEPKSEDKLKATAQLFVATVLFATNPVVVRTLYSVVETHPPVYLWNAGAALSAAVTGIAVLLAQSRSAAQTKSTERSRLFTDQATQLAGLELGFWKFMGATANVMGLSLTTASQAGFCTQMTTLIVPLLESLLGVVVPGRVWAACLLAVAGVGVISLDSVATAGGDAGALLVGDALCVLAAVFYATFDVRLNAFSTAQRLGAADLVAGKMVSQTLFSAGAAAALWAADAGQRAEYAGFFASVTPEEMTTILAAMIWNGCIVNFLATYIQVPAAAAVGPSRAQVVYSANPLIGAALAVALLGEGFSLRAGAGAAAFVGALLLAAGGGGGEEEEGSGKDGGGGSNIFSA